MDQCTSDYDKQLQYITRTTIQVGGICTSQGQQGSLEQAGIAGRCLMASYHIPRA